MGQVLSALAGDQQDEGDGEGEEAQAAPADGERHEQFHLADHVVDLLQVGFGAGAPGFQRGHFFFQHDDFIASVSQTTNAPRLVPT